MLVFSSLLNTSNLRCVSVVFCFSIMASVAGDTPSPSLGLINSGAKSKALTNKPIMNSQLFMPRIYKVFLLKIAMTKCFLFLFSRGKRFLCIGLFPLGENVLLVGIKHGFIVGIR